MSLRITGSALLLLLFLGTTPLFAQDANSCRAAEQELKVYFESIYQTGQVPRIDIVENAWTNCAQPSPMMKLLYYYFQSAYALTHQAADKRMSYMDASYLYELSLRESSVLTALPKEQEPFAKLYTQRAKWLDGQISQRGNTLGYRTRGAGSAPSRASQQPTSGTWQKTNLEAPTTATSSNSDPTHRSAQATGATFEKQYLYQGVYQEDPWEEVEPDQMLDPWYRGGADQKQAREPYGKVGEIGNLNIMAYLAFKNGEEADADNSDNLVGNLSSLRLDDPQGNTRAATATETYRPTYELYGTEEELRSPMGTPAPPSASPTTRLNTTTTRGMGVSKGQGTTRGVTQSTNRAITLAPSGNNYTNLYDPLAIRSLPSGSAPSVAIAAFGETLAPVPGEQEIVGNGIWYVRVRNDRGQEGWAEKSALVKGARLATIVRETVAYSSPQAQAAPIACYPAQLVILADIRGNWVQGFTEHGEQEEWFNSIDAMSINPRDVAIAQAYQEAKKLSLMQSRKKEMIAIRSIPGYSQSPLRNVVEAYISGL